MLLLSIAAKKVWFMTSPPARPVFESFGDSEDIYGVPGLPFVPAIRVPANRDLIFVSGVLGPPSADDDEPGMRAEVGRLLRNLERILGLSGASLDDVVSVTKFLVNISRDNSEVVEGMKEFFAHLPTSTTVEVSRLVPGDLRLEISAVAAVPAK